MHCPNCNTEIREGSLYCHQCGSLLEALKEFKDTKAITGHNQHQQVEKENGQGESLMRIRFDSSELLSDISRIFSCLTDMAEICVNDIQYDDANGVVEIPMKRRDVIQQTRKGCFGLFLPPTTSGYTWFDSILTIRQVVRMKMDIDDLLVTDCNSCFSAMMGVKIGNREIYLGSLEEVSGKTLCNVYIIVNGYELELVDRVRLKNCTPSPFYTNPRAMRIATH